MTESLYNEWDPEVGKVAMMRGISRREAIRVLEARDARIDAQYEADKAAQAARDAELAAQASEPITEAFAKTIEKKFARGLDKAQRSRFRMVIDNDDALWQRIANPQTREAAIRSLSLAQARRFLNK